jgi:hypothetical protein
MKYYITILLLLILNNVQAQCTDAYGVTVECPTANDSIVIYENSLKVYEYYEMNKSYRKIASQSIKTNKDIRNCFRRLDSSLTLFKSIWQLRERYLRGENVNMADQGILLPRDGNNIPISDYYESIDEYRFFQRELECGILNTSSPFPIYDSRISPRLINTYRNTKIDDFSGDEVQIALYVPVTIKPFSMLTQKELDLRNKILGRKDKLQKRNEPKDTQIIIKAVDTLTKKVTLTRVVFQGNITSDMEGNPVYYTNGITYCFIGTEKKGIFRRVPKSKYKEYAVPKFGRLLLEDEKKLKAALKIKFGEYIKQIL